jgi:hypothetical protein
MQGGSMARISYITTVYDPTINMAKGRITAKPWFVASNNETPSVVLVADVSRCFFLCGRCRHQTINGTFPTSSQDVPSARPGEQRGQVYTLLWKWHLLAWSRSMPHVTIRLTVLIEVEGLLLPLCSSPGVDLHSLWSMHGAKHGHLHVAANCRRCRCGDAMLRL